VCSSDLEKAASDANQYVQRAASHTVALLKGEPGSGARPAKAAKAAKKRAGQ